MKIIGIATARPGITQEQLKPYMEAEAKEAWRLYEADIIRENYTRADHPGVVTVFECESVAQAEKICRNFPLVRAELIDFEFIPLGYFKPWAGNLAQWDLTQPEEKFNNQKESNESRFHDRTQAAAPSDECSRSGA